MKTDYPNTYDERRHRQALDRMLADMFGARDDGQRSAARDALPSHRERRAPATAETGRRRAAGV